ncbi:hypothetical protein A7U60_g2138 [Sanghuangporus baumii]|uniref:Reverse transcriptase Ty1/copia-type domain-containing protein n=1 Tax=Sanghuangporus baumii TaxID=108892 RepID=A0A9Q5I377_SANBA|nr:hypothetical protein A7U60_g2138 [Sanghuangporus baumii]
MWVFAIKEQADATLDFRARWVARGDSQVPGLEFGETFAASGDFISARFVCALSCDQQSELVTLDISSAYLHSPLLEQDLIVKYSTGFSIPGFSRPTCRLKRALYGLRQGARAWSEHFSAKLSDLGFKKCISAPTVFVRSDSEGGKMVISTHVDDCTSATRLKTLSGPNSAVQLRTDIKKYFDFKEKDPRRGANMLGITLKYDEEAGTIKLSLAQKIE